MDKLRKYTSHVFKPPLLFILITDSTAFPNAILSAAKNLNLTGAVMSMFSLQTSMLYAFSEDQDSLHRIMNAVTGGFVLVIVLGIAGYMIVHGTKIIKKSVQYSSIQ